MIILKNEQALINFRALERLSDVRIFVAHVYFGCFCLYFVLNQQTRTPRIFIGQSAHMRTASVIWLHPFPVI